MPRVHPAVASLLMVIVHSVLSLAMYPLIESEVAVSVLALAAMTLPGVVAGYLTTARPLLVAIGGVGAIWCVQTLASSLFLGSFSWEFVPFFIQGELVQGVASCVACIATFLLRSRASAKPFAAAR